MTPAHPFGIEDRVARIKFARRAERFNIAMMREIRARARRVHAGARAGGRVFEAERGARLQRGVGSRSTWPTPSTRCSSLHDIFRRSTLAKPVVAVVDGAALGGGCELAAACDIVIASERARFGQPEIKLGVFPPVAAVLLPRVIGEKRARELVLTGELIEAPEALRLGLVNHGVNSAQLEQKLQEVLNRLRELSASALTLTRRALDAGRGYDLARLARVETLYLKRADENRRRSGGVRPSWRSATGVAQPWTGRCRRRAERNRRLIPSRLHSTMLTVRPLVMQELQFEKVGTGRREQLEQLRVWPQESGRWSCADSLEFRQAGRLSSPARAASRSQAGREFITTG